MASISIMITDNTNGVINSSFNFSEQDIKRIEKALGSIYKPQLELPPLVSPAGERVPQPYDPSPRDVYAVLSKSLVSYVVNTCHDEELNQIVNAYKENTKPIEMREND